MPRLSYIGQIQNGKLILNSPRRQKMTADIAGMRDGRMVEIELRPLPRRSNPQNAYYWGVVIALIMEELQKLGHEVNADQTHEVLKSKFNSKPLCNADGELIGEIGETTTLMNKTEFGEYLDKIKRWAATYLNLNIPDPESQTQLDFKTYEHH